MKPLQILMPMGGLGQRFRDAGIDTPKPLIPVLGTPMFMRALSSFDKYEGDKHHIFVVRKDTDEEYALSQQIKQILPDAKIKVIDYNTQGAVETCLAAEEYIDPDSPLVIMDCDIAFDSEEYFAKIKKAVEHSDFDGLLLSFDSNDPRYSFAEMNASGFVLRTAEKIAISNNALMGAYFFTKAELFISAAHELMKRQIDESLKEYYVSLIYNILLDGGKRIGLSKGIFYCFGTPEELDSFLAANT